MSYYESTFIVDSQLPDEVIRQKVGHFQEVVSSNGGEILHLEQWGNRRLAYEIRKRSQGYYVFMQISASPQGVRELERALRLDESVLRFLTIVVEEKAVKRDSTEQAEEE